MLDQYHLRSGQRRAQNPTGLILKINQGPPNVADQAGLKQNIESAATSATEEVIDGGKLKHVGFTIGSKQKEDMLGMRQLIKVGIN